MMRQKLVWLASALIVIALVWYGVNWLLCYVERPALTILAAHDVPGNGLPVFAQFIFTQTLKLHEPIEATKLVVPIYFPLQNSPIQVDLKNGDKLLQRWRYQSRFEETTKEVVLVFDPPLQLQGDLELIFNARQVAYEDQAKAPRVFVETADANYPDGNYRIAENVKQGDIGMSLWQRQSHLELLNVGYQQQRPLFIGQMLLGIFVMLFLGTLPFQVLAWR